MVFWSSSTQTTRDLKQEVQRFWQDWGQGAWTSCWTSHQKCNMVAPLLSTYIPLSGGSLANTVINGKINCLRYKVYSEGEFLLRSPKRMTGTEGFLEQNSGERSECQRERQETCEIRNFAEKGFENCACRPWGLLSALPSEVWASSQKTKPSLWPTSF